MFAESSDTARRIQPTAASNSSCESGGDPLAGIVAACLRGEQGAYRSLYDSCRQNVYGLALRMVGRQDAADVTQQVFLQAFRSMGRFRGRSLFTVWLYRLAVNESLQHLRRNRRSRHLSLDWEPMDVSHSGNDPEGKELLERALAQVDPELRSIFILREVEGLSYKEIAESLRIPEGTVGSRLNRARRELQQRLSDMGFEPN